MADTVLEQLVAERAIRRLISSYCDAVSRRDPDSVGILFTPDARVVIAGGAERTGRQEVVEGLRRTIAGFSHLHQKCDTGLIDVDGDHARARIGVMEVNRPVDKDGLNLIFGHYEDEYWRTEEGWRFDRRRFTLQLLASVSAAELQQFPAIAPEFTFRP